MLKKKKKRKENKKKTKPGKNLSSGHTLKLEMQLKLFIKNKHRSVLKNTFSVLSTKLENPGLLLQS